MTCDDHTSSTDLHYRLTRCLFALAAQPNHDPNTHHCLCGADGKPRHESLNRNHLPSLTSRIQVILCCCLNGSFIFEQRSSYFFCFLCTSADLIMLGLATHEPNFTIIREEFKPNKPRPCALCGQVGHEIKDCQGVPREKQGQVRSSTRRVMRLSAEGEHLFVHISWCLWYRFSAGAAQKSSAVVALQKHFSCSPPALRASSLFNHCTMKTESLVTPADQFAVMSVDWQETAVSNHFCHIWIPVSSLKCVWIHLKSKRLFCSTTSLQTRCRWPSRSSSSSGCVSCVRSVTHCFLQQVLIDDFRDGLLTFWSQTWNWNKNNEIWSDWKCSLSLLPFWFLKWRKKLETVKRLSNGQTTAVLVKVL